MGTFIELNFIDTEDGVAYSAVLDSGGEPVVLCDGITNTGREALNAIFNHLKTVIK